MKNDNIVEQVVPMVIVEDAEPPFDKGESSDNANIVIQLFLEWCYRGALGAAKPTTSQKIKKVVANTAGFIVGGLSVSSIYPLSGNFGDVVSDALHITDNTGRKALYHFFAVNGIIPMLCLSCIEAKDLFTRIAHSTSNDAITKPHHPYIKRGLTAAAYILAVFSALSPMYATLDVFKQSALWVKILTIPASFVGPMIFKAAAELRFIDKALSYLTTKEEAAIKMIRATLKKDMTTVRTVVEKMPNEQVELLFTDIIKKNEPTDNNQLAAQRALIVLNKLSELKNHSELQQVNQITAPQTSRLSCSFWGRKVCQGAGFVIGAASSYVYYTLAEAATIYLCNLVGIQDLETQNILKNIVASLSIIPWGVLGAESTQTIFDRIYNIFGGKSLQDWKAGTRMQKAIPFVSVFEGIFASFAPTYLAMQALNTSPWYAKVLILPAFLGPASIRTMAVSRIMNEGLEWFEERGEMSPAIMRKKIITSIEKIDVALSHLPDEQIMALYHQLAKEKPELLDRVEIQVTETCLVNSIESEHSLLLPSGITHKTYS